MINSMEGNKDIYRIFFSWQADKSKVRSAIFGKLNEAKAALAKEGWHVEIDQDTNGRVGTENIDTEVLAKISNCDVFVADVTPIYVETLDKGEDSAKLVPNPNVMYESGYALGIKGMHRMIFLASLEEGETIERLPFDINHNTITIIQDPEKMGALTGRIRKILEVVKEEREQRVPENGCVVLFETEKGSSEAIEIAPEYVTIQYVKKNIASRRPKEERPKSNSLLTSGVLAALCEQILQKEPVAVAKIIKEEIDHSVCPITIALHNYGENALEEIDMFMQIDTPDVQFVEERVHPLMFAPKIGTTDYFIGENGIHSHIEYLNSGLHHEFDTIYVKVPYGVESIDLTWSVYSKNHKERGNIHIVVRPVCDRYDTRVDNTRDGETEVIPYIEDVCD